jgi:hypothetical protein
MKKFRAGKLHSGGPNGKIVTDPKQAYAIEKSEEHNESEHGGHYVHKNPLAGKRRKRS